MPKKLLIIEDEESIRKALQTALEALSIELHLADNGEEGLKAALSLKPDLIILDIVMPKMHGIDMLDQLQSDEWGKTVPVIILTNYGDDPKVQRAIEAKRAELMRKTHCKLQDVVDRIKEKLEI